MQGLNISNTRTIAEREDEGTTVHVRGADSEQLYFQDGAERKPVTLLVAGTYSKIYRRTIDSQREKLLKQRRSSLSSEQIARQQLEAIAACILGWEGIFNGDQALPLNKENAITLLESAPWVREQVEEAMNDHAAFFTNSSTI